MFSSLGSATYPVISTDGGTSWRVIGPEFYVAAAQGANNTTSVGAFPPNGAFVWGQNGDAVRVTNDGGTTWWAAGFPWGVFSVTSDGGTIKTVALGPQDTDGTFKAYLYASTDSGHTWTFQGQQANVKL